MESLLERVQVQSASTKSFSAKTPECALTCETKTASTVGNKLRMVEDMSNKLAEVIVLRPLTKLVVISESEVKRSLLNLNLWAYCRALAIGVSSVRLLVARVSIYPVMMSVPRADLAISAQLPRLSLAPPSEKKAQSKLKLK
jgi:hypothetical protein